jgi:Fe-S cluster biogenesis protein NfuA
MSARNGLPATAERIETLVDELGALADPRARQAGDELVQALMQFYGAGLARVLEIVDDEPADAARRMFARFADDPLVASLLVLHDLHPDSVETRVSRAIDRVRPELDTNGAELTLVEVRDGVARLRLEGSGNGHGSAAKTTKRSLERAIEAAAPEIARVEVEGLQDDPPALVQLTRVARVHA